MKKHNILLLLKKFNITYKIIGNTELKYFTNVKPIHEADKDSISWLHPKHPGQIQLIHTTKSPIIICHHDIVNFLEIKNLNKCLILVENPKLVFSKIINDILIKKCECGIHPSAYIHPNAQVHSDTYIGPFTYIGDSTIIEKDTIIEGNCFIYDNTVIQKGVFIQAGAVIGSDGFGYVKDKDKKYLHFPHFGNVIIEDNVTIGANSCIDRGTLGSTRINYGTKINNLVHIAHNVIIGKNNLIGSQVSISGSTFIGDNSYIAPGVIIRNKLKLGNNIYIGLGAVVTKDIPDGETWVGLPARPIKEFQRIQDTIKKIASTL